MTIKANIYIPILTGLAFLLFAIAIQVFLFPARKPSQATKQNVEQKDSTTVAPQPSQVLALPGVNRLAAKKKDSVEAKKRAWATLLANHPFNNRPQRTPKEWKAIPKADRPDLAMEQNFLMTMDPKLRQVPYERMRTANRRVEQLLLEKSAIAGVEWEERGPNNVGGRTRAFMFDPNDVNHKKVWAGGVAGGLWVTNDITANPVSWTHVDGFWDNIAITCIAYNPANTQEFYVGTGEGFGNSDAVRGGGIWKTTNGGSTWSRLANTDPGAYNSTSHFHYIQKIVIKDNGTIFAATRAWFVNAGGIIRSTNGGTSWSRVLTVYTTSGDPTDWGADVEVAANGDVYASVGLSSSGRVFKSLNADNGNSGTWTNLSTNIGIAGAKRIELACAPSDANVIYAVAQGGTGDDDIEWFKKSTDGGMTWTTITTPIVVDNSGAYVGKHFTRGQAFYDLILAVHPTNPDFVIAGGIDLHRTLNGGTSWTGISHWYGGFSKPEVHADQHAIQFRPGASNELIFGNDGGIYYSTNAGNSGATPSFENKNNGYNVTQFYACAAKNEVNSHYFLAGAQDNGSNQFTTPQIGSTTEVTGGDGAFCHIDQLNPLIQTTQYTFNTIYRSLNGGTTFPQLISEASGHFINPTEYDSQRKILYAAANNNQLKRISGMDGTITNTNLSVTVSDVMSPSKVSSIKLSPYNDVLILGIANGRVYKYTDASTGTPTLTRIDNGATPITTAGWVSSIDIGANDNHILVTYSNYGVTSVWETTDGGTTWYSKEGNLPDIPIRWGLYNPNNRNQVLVATELGVWTTDNFGFGTNSAPVWGPSNTMLANTRCDMLKYRAADKMVVVATHGRGLFTSDIFAATSVANFTVDQTTSCTGSLTVQFTDGSLKPNNSWAWDMNNDGVTDYTSRNPTHTYSSPGLYSVKLTINSGAAQIIKDKYILVSNSAPTTSTGCALSPNSNLNNNAGIGIYRFALGNIDYTSSHNDGNQDYTCSQWTPLELNTVYYITIRTGTANNEGAKVYIDYNDNGNFEVGEEVVSFPTNTVGTRTLSFTTPSSGVTLNKGLRLRALSRITNPITTACTIGTFGQAEDYTVYFASPSTYADYGDLDNLIWAQAKATVIFTDADNNGVPDGSGSAVWAGNLVDAESGQQASDYTNGFADEDGLVFPFGNLTRGQNYNFTVQTNSNSTTAITRYYRLWFDWDNNGTFEDSYTGNVVGTGVVAAVQNVVVSLTAVDNYKIRLVVDDTSIPVSPASGTFTNAEVEDYANETPLPIELITFESHTDKCDVTLYWETASEKNLGYFQLEASKDGRTFEGFNQLKPASPNASSKQVYKYKIPAELQGYYFRLKTVDLDQSFQYSPILYTEAPCKKVLTAILYPNPNITSDITVEINNSETDASIELQLLNNLGQIIRRQNVSLSEGINKATIETADLSAGIYFIQITGVKEFYAPLRFVRN